jgi:hypothetical protein
MTLPSAPTGTGRPALPLFYRKPQLLSSQVHGEWRVKPGDVSFAAGTPYVPIVAGEFSAAARCYPIVFAAADTVPVAVLGLEHSNLFVDGARWAADAYVPAYVRRYPFGFLATTNPAGFALVIDSASERVLTWGSEGTPLFEDGKPSELTNQALRFCEMFEREARATELFREALRAQSLLVDRRANATLPDGSKLGLHGFQVIDAEKFSRLEDSVVVDWHRKGWLALVSFHLASLERFSALLERQSARAAAKAAV